VFCGVCLRGLDNSGKTTIVLKINGEDTSVISPTLGFNIKTIKYHKYVPPPFRFLFSPVWL
jgi:ADP-ribosylation factor-like protein 2